jgi:hypothetical protein
MVYLTMLFNLCKRGKKLVAKLTDFKTPTGTSGNLLNPMDWLQLILGVVVLLATFGIGQNIANKINGKGPFDTEIEQPWKSPTPVQTIMGAPSHKVI